MLTPTGHADLDEAIQDFWDKNGWLRTARPMDGVKGVRIQDLIDPEAAKDRCGHVSNLFSQYLSRRGFATVTTDNLYLIDRSELAAAGKLMFEGRDMEHIPTPADHGYDDRTIEGAKDHCAVLVKAGDDVIMVDLTARQYGYDQIPLIQRQMPDGSWERDFARPALGADESPMPAAADSSASIEL